MLSKAAFFGIIVLSTTIAAIPRRDFSGNNAVNVIQKRSPEALPQIRINAPARARPDGTVSPGARVSVSPFGVRIRPPVGARAGAAPSVSVSPLTGVRVRPPVRPPAAAVTALTTAH
ncbi:hypothetical protein PYCC9005_001237 [Savitreella phatthalungensis]